MADPSCPTLASLQAELTDPALPSDRVEAIFQKALDLWMEAMTTTTPGPTDLLCALARHPSLPLERVQQLHSISTGEMETIDWPAVRAALHESPSLVLHQLGGEVSNG